MAIVARSISGATAAAVVVSDNPVTLNGFSVNATNTGGASTITLRDSAALATGTILFQQTIPTQTAATTITFDFPTSVKAKVGIVATIATTAVGDISFWLN